MVRSFRALFLKSALRRKVLLKTIILNVAPGHAGASKVSWLPTVFTQPKPSEAPPTSTLFKHILATIGTVIISSAFGHFITSSLLGSKKGAKAAITRKENWDDIKRGPCDRELKQFIKCAQDQTDLSLCGGFNEDLWECIKNNS